MGDYGTCGGGIVGLVGESLSENPLISGVEAPAVLVAAHGEVVWTVPPELFVPLGEDIDRLVKTTFQRFTDAQERRNDSVIQYVAIYVLRQLSHGAVSLPGVREWVLRRAQQEELRDRAPGQGG